MHLLNTRGAFFDGQVRGKKRTFKVAALVGSRFGTGEHDRSVPVAEANRPAIVGIVAERIEIFIHGGFGIGRPILIEECRWMRGIGPE
jgi:hypothetical protein